jgi:nicotinamidase-related amidase
MKVLVIIDMQKDFIDGSLGTPEAQAIVPNVVDKLRAHKNTNTVVLFTKDTHHANYLTTSEGEKLPVEHCIEGTEGWAIDRAIHNEFKSGGYATYSAGDIINGRITKPTFGSYDLIDAFCDIDAQTEEGISEIEFCGVCTDICVISNVLMTKAAFWDIPITVDASCCAGITPERHAAALEVMKSCQIDVIGE